MASSSKTPNLGLNLWSGSDSPKMADFNNDNTLIDTAIKNLQDQGGGGSSAAPVSSSYVGDGEDVHIIELGFTPTWGIVYAHNKPPCATVEDGTATQVNFVYLTPGGRSVGCYLSNGKLEVYQETAGHSGYRMNMNQSGVTYYYMFYR